MAIGDLASVVDLRAGAILLGVAAAHFAVTAQMDALHNYCGGICRHCVPNRLRDFFRAADRPMGVAVRQPRLTRGRGSFGLVWWTAHGIAWQLGAGLALFVNVNYRCGFAKQRSDETYISAGRTARGRCVCDSGGTNRDRLRGKYWAISEQPRPSVCRTNQLRTLRLSHPRSDAFGPLVAVSIAIRSHDTLFAFSRVRDRHALNRDIVVAIVGRTDIPAAWRNRA